MLAERFPRCPSFPVWMPPFEKVPSCDDEVKGCKRVGRASLDPPVVMIELGAEFVSRNEIEESSHGGVCDA